MNIWMINDDIAYKDAPYYFYFIIIIIIIIFIIHIHIIVIIIIIIILIISRDGVTSWFLGGYQGHAIDFDQYQDSETRRSSYPWLLSWHVSPDISSNYWIEYNRRINFISGRLYNR